MSVRSAAAVVASFAAFAAGCAGGSDSEQEGWADSVCAPFVEWRAEDRALEEELQEEMRAQPFPSPSGDVLETASDVGSAVSEATEDLLAQLEDVGAPPVEDEQDAADVLGGLSISLEETRDGIEGQVGSSTPSQRGRWRKRSGSPAARSGGRWCRCRRRSP
jgi:hypothetical protein